MSPQEPHVVYAAQFAKQTGTLTGDFRKEAAYRLGEHLAVLDLSYAETWAAFQEFNRLACIPPLVPGDSAAGTVRTSGLADLTDDTPDIDAELLRRKAALRPSPTPVANSSRMRMAGDISLDDLPDFLIDGILVENSIHAFYGATGAGKTFAAIDMALCIATGRPWFGRDTLPAAVLWIAAEDSFGVDKRVRAWIDHTGLSGIPFATLDDKEFHISKEETIQDIVDKAEQLLQLTGMPRLLIVADTLSKVSKGTDENSGKDLSEVMAGFDRLRRRLPTATVCIIHHSGKSEGAGLRGHSSLGQGIDSFALVRKTGSGHTIAFEKVKNSELPPLIGFALEGAVLGKYKNGKDIKSCVVVPRETRPIEIGPVNLPKQAAEFLASLKGEIKDDGIGLPSALTGADNVRGCSKKAWRLAVQRQLQEEMKANTARAAWRKTSKYLIDGGHVVTGEVNGEEYVWVVDNP